MAESVRHFIIQGITSSGHTFRPSDWAERLAGVMSPFRPQGSAASHLTYSPYVFPTVIGGVKCVVVDPRLRQLEPLAWKFVVDFAHDNDLQTAETEGPLADLPIKRKG
ncbi:DUF3579 domain-containing protein [Pigmentiphaga soli]|uniref:DUF3579 domain-containing protein n=1 Tax=Pigmentiphaga soli TaxID=1007095 RepID=A0ABP8HR95_9BURK